MPTPKLTEAQLRDALAALTRSGGNISAAARQLGLDRTTYRHRLKEASRRGISADPPAAEAAVSIGGDILDGHLSGRERARLTQQVHRKRLDDGTIEVSVGPKSLQGVEAYWTDDTGVRHYGLTTEEELRACGNVPESYRLVQGGLLLNSWAGVDQRGPYIAHQVKARFEADPNVELVVRLLEQLEEKAPVVPAIPRPKPITRHRRLLEIDVVDIHYALRSFAPAADLDYSGEVAARLTMEAAEQLIQQAAPYGPFELVLAPFGSDLLHADGLWHRTTGGTDQPEMDAWHHAYIGAEQLMIAFFDRLKQLAPVRAIQVPGNHDRQSSFTLGRVLRAYYRNDANVEVDASPSPYKFQRFGVNLIGFEHGHSIPPIRMAALMANERPDDWAATAGGFREWHLGDQHRKGQSPPVTMEEQGVSVEYLPGLCAPNEWHRLKSFNHQKRGATAFVWDHERGPIARCFVCVNSLTGELLGLEKAG